MGKSNWQILLNRDADKPIQIRVKNIHNSHTDFEMYRFALCVCHKWGSVMVVDFFIYFFFVKFRARALQMMTIFPSNCVIFFMPMRERVCLPVEHLFVLALKFEGFLDFYFYSKFYYNLIL